MSLLHQLRSSKLVLYEKPFKLFLVKPPSGNDYKFVFKNISIGAFYYRGFESQSSSVAAQPVGFSSALKAAKERIAVRFKSQDM